MQRHTPSTRAGAEVRTRPCFQETCTRHLLRRKTAKPHATTYNFAVRTFGNDCYLYAYPLPTITGYTKTLGNSWTGTITQGSGVVGHAAMCYIKDGFISTTVAPSTTTRGTTLPPAAAANAPVQRPVPIAASAAAPQPKLTAPSLSNGWSSTDTALTVSGAALALGVAFGVYNHAKLGALVKRIVGPQSRIPGLGYAGLESTADLM